VSKSYVTCQNQADASKNYTNRSNALFNASKFYWLCQNHTSMCQNHTFHILINFVRGKITLELVKFILLCAKIIFSLSKPFLYGSKLHSTCWNHTWFSIFNTFVFHINIFRVRIIFVLTFWCQSYIIRVRIKLKFVKTTLELVGNHILRVKIALKVLKSHFSCGNHTIRRKKAHFFVSHSHISRVKIKLMHVQIIRVTLQRFNITLFVSKSHLRLSKSYFYVSKSYLSCEN
jgi:hypothetical protein